VLTSSLQIFVHGVNSIVVVTLVSKFLEISGFYLFP
jgi:hypothetical protein